MTTPDITDEQLARIKVVNLKVVRLYEHSDLNPVEIAAALNFLLDAFNKAVQTVAGEMITKAASGGVN